MAFEGDLSNLALGDVLQTLAMSRQAGTFVVRTQKEERRLVFGPRGCGLLTVKQRVHDRVGDYVRGHGLVSPGQFDEALRTVRRRRASGLPIEEALREQGALTDDDILAARRYVASEEIHELFAWRKGTFSFQDGDPGDLSPYGNVWFDVVGFVMEAARRMDEVRRLVETCPENEIFVRSDADGDAAPNAKPDLEQVLLLVDGIRSVKTILESSHLGRFDALKAIESLRESGRIRPADLQELAATADQLAGARDPARAVPVLRRVLAARPGDDAVHRRLVEALEASGRRSEASDEWVELGRRAWSAGFAEDAVSAFKQAVRLEAESPAAHDGLARALFAAGDTEGGAAEARTASSLHLNANRPDQAVAIADVAVRALPEDASFHVILGNAYATAGDPATGLRSFEEAVVLLETAGGEERRLLEIYKRILQLDPGRNDAARRVSELESSGMSKRTKLLRYAGAAGGVLVLAAIAFPLLRGPGFEARIETARADIAAGRLEEAGALLDALTASSPSEDQEIEIRSVRNAILRRTPKEQSDQIQRRFTASFERISRDAQESQKKSWSEGLDRFADGFDLLDGPDARTVAATDLDQLNRFRRELLADLNGAVSALYGEVTVACSLVAATRDGLATAPSRREEIQYLQELADRTEEVAKLRASQDWRRIPKQLDSLQKRGARIRDSLDKKVGEAVESMLEAFPEIEREGARSLAALRRKRLIEKHTEAYGKGRGALGSGRLDEAYEIYAAFVAYCEELRAAQPSELYEAIVNDYIDGMNLEAPQRERMREIERIQDDERQADAALARGDIEEAFRIRTELVKQHRDVDFRERFRLPIRVESTPVGARVFAIGADGAVTELGVTPLDRLEYPLDTGIRLSIRLDGFEDQAIERRGALDDASGIAKADLPKLAEFVVPGAGSVQSPPVEVDGRIVCAGRDGLVRVRSGADGLESGQAFSTASLAGVAGAPASFAGRVFVATLDAKGFLLSARDLSRLRELKFDGPVRGSLLATRHGVVAATEAGTLQLLDREGERVWSKSVGKVTTDPALAGDRIVVVSGEGELVSLDTATGDREVRIRLPEEPRWNGPATSGDLVYLAGDSGTLACVDLISRRVVWTNTVGEGVRARPAVVGTRLIVVTSKGAVLTIDRKDGTVLGRNLLGGSARHPPLAVPDGYVAATERGLVVRFDLEGRVTWRYDAKEDIGSPPSLVADRIVFVTRRGSLVSLRP